MGRYDMCEYEYIMFIAQNFPQGYNPLHSGEVRKISSLGGFVKLKMKYWIW
jgi:hypothetical protein